MYFAQFCTVRAIPWPGVYITSHFLKTGTPIAAPMSFAPMGLLVRPTQKLCRDGRFVPWNRANLCHGIDPAFPFSLTVLAVTGVTSDTGSIP